MARGLSYVPYGFPSCEQEDEGLKAIGLGAVAEQRGGLVVDYFSSVLSGPKMLWFRAGDRSLPVSCFSPCHCDLTSPPSPFYLWKFFLTSRRTTIPFKVAINLQGFVFSLPEEMTSHVESHCSVCRQSPPDGRRPRRRESRTPAHAPPPKIIRAAHIRTAHKPTPETHSLHAGLVGIPSSLSGRKGTEMSVLPLSLSMSPQPSLSSISPPAAPSP